MPLNQPDIKELRAIVDWANLTPDMRELSIKFGDVELFISRDRQSSGGPAAAAQAPAPAAVAAPSAPAASPAPAPVPAPAAQVPASNEPAPSPAELAADEVLIKAPMVGTFYASP